MPLKQRNQTKTNHTDIYKEMEKKKKKKKKKRHEMKYPYLEQINNTFD